jgi:hypothetical protein
MKKPEELKSLDSSQEKFQSAYTIQGKGVGKLELDKALNSTEFRKATKELVKKIKAGYPNLNEANTNGQ